MSIASAISCAEKPSTSNISSAARWLARRCWTAATKASSTLSRCSARSSGSVRERLQPRDLVARLVERRARLGRRPVVDRQHPPLLALELVQARVGGDPVQPRAQRRAALEVGAPAPGAQAHLLQHVLGVVRRAEHPVAVGAQFGAEAFERILHPSILDSGACRGEPRRKGGTLKDGERRQLAYASRRAGVPLPEVEPGDRVRVLCDGGSRGNPGPAAVAAVRRRRRTATGSRSARVADRPRDRRRGRVPGDPARARARRGRRRRSRSAATPSSRSSACARAKGPPTCVAAARAFARRALGLAPARGQRGRRRARARRCSGRVLAGPFAGMGHR